MRPRGRARPASKAAGSRRDREGRPQNGVLWVDVKAFFVGRALNAVDAKGRVSLPADMRDTIAARARHIAQTQGEHISDRHLYVGPHPTLPCLRGCDLGYLPAQFAKLQRAVSELPVAEQEAALEMAQVELFSGLEKTAFDDPGRMVLPPAARRMAGIEGQALFLAAGETFQIWNPETLLACDAVPERSKQAVRDLMAARG